MVVAVSSSLRLEKAIVYRQLEGTLRLVSVLMDPATHSVQTVEKPEFGNYEIPPIAR